MPCYSPLKGYKCPETGGLVFKRNNTKETMEVACGQCLGCRLDRSRMWAIRLVHESSLHTRNSFVSLTYRDRLAATRDQVEANQVIPEDWSLNVEHFQKFMKRLRKARKGARIKYYHCGEYGSICEHGIDLDLSPCTFCKVGRPHYHAILLGCGFDDKEPYKEKDGRTYYMSPELEKLWGYGNVDVGEVNFETCAYTARYIMKKVTGEPATEHYRKIDTATGQSIKLQPEYSTMSNGIGKTWYERYKSDCWPSDEVPLPGVGVIKKVPRYYEERLKNENEQLHAEVKLLRQKYRKENAAEYTAERLMDKYKVKKAQTGQLVRD